ncbi:MAG TPA: hypothetical protein VMS89_01675, partial [Methanoregulaceae archaeon]|nr:hypothetical protein [Methanoregulaceae archaeon]
SLHTKSGISAAFVAVRSLFRKEKPPEPPLKQKLSADPELFSLILKEQELGELFEDTRETKESKESKTILYTEQDLAPSTVQVTMDVTAEVRLSRSAEEMNPYFFTQYSCTREEFGMFEERPMDLPESNYSVTDQDRWRLMHRNREENTFL